MSKLPRKRIELFGESMPGAEYGLAQFGSLAAGNPVFSTDPEVLQALPAYKQGWNAAVVNQQSPAMEDRNALDYILSYNQVYISQMGIPEWIATQTYYKGSVVTDGNESLYISLVDNNLNNAVTDDVYWAKFPTPTELAATNARIDYITPAPGSLAFGPLTTMPGGYLLCNGQAVSRSEYAALFAAIGTNFGSGDGSTTFNVPDYRGCFLRGLGGDSAANMYTKQNSGSPNITGSADVYKVGYNGSGTGQGALSLSAGGEFGSQAGQGGPNTKIVLDASASSSVYQNDLTETRPTNYAVNFFIKY